MYPNLYYLLNDLLGVELGLFKIIHTFGFLVAVAFITSAWTLSKEFRRKEALGLMQKVPRKVHVGAPATTNEMVMNGVLGFIIGFKLLEAFLNFEALTYDPQRFILSTRGNLLGGLAGAALFAWLKYREKDKKKLKKPEWKTEMISPFQLVGDITIAAAIFGFIGAKIFHNLEYWKDFVADPLGQLGSFSGLTFYGGLLFGWAGVIWYGTRYKIPAIHIHDAAAPGLMLAYGVGRIGCHMSGDGDWGIVNLADKPGWLSWAPDWVWAYTYPNNVLRDGIPIEGCIGDYCSVLPEAVYPTPLYEAVICLILFAGLWSIRKHIKIAGMMFSLYLVLNGIERYFIQQIRVESMNPKAQYDFFGGIAQAELIALALILVGIAGMIWSWKRSKREINE
jgi:prolipoprotein diacylglyceryltransferase